MVLEASAVHCLESFPWQPVVTIKTVGHGPVTLPCHLWQIYPKRLRGLCRLSAIFTTRESAHFCCTWLAGVLTGKSTRKSTPPRVSEGYSYSLEKWKINHCSSTYWQGKQVIYLPRGERTHKKKKKLSVSC